jgi:hypothetical protein
MMARKRDTFEPVTLGHICGHGCRMSDSTNVLSKRRFGPLSIWVALGSSIISFGATVLLFWVAASWMERPFSLNSPHADVVQWFAAGILYFERFAHLIGFCLGVAAMFRRGDRRWLGFFGACLNVLLSSFADALLP